MFLLQLQLDVLTVNRVTLYRIQKPFRRKSTFCKFKYTILSKAGYKESQFYKLYTVIVAKEPYTDQLYLQESTWFLFMHQSIPPAPSSPPGNCGAFARLVSPGGGAFENFALPGGRAFANPRAISELLTRTRFSIRI